MDMEKIRLHARNIRVNALKMIAKAGSGHPGGSLSIADILAVLYFDKMRVDPEDPAMENRDRLVLSKGHAAPGLYAALFEKGYFDAKEMENLRQVHSMLQGHPDMKGTPGVDMTTGSLGQGLSTAVGMALGAKYKKSDVTVYSIIGDGEIQEGQIWEAAMSTSHYKLNNLILGGSVLKHLPLAQVMIPSGSLLGGRTASPSPTPPACVPSVAISLPVK